MGQQLIMENMHKLSLHLQMDPPLITLEAYRQQVAWPGDQPSTDRGEEPSRAAIEDPTVDEDLIANLAGADWGPWADLGRGST